MKAILSILTLSPFILTLAEPYLPGDIWAWAVTLTTGAMIYAAFNGGKSWRSVCSLSALFVTLGGAAEFYAHLHEKPADLSLGMLMLTTGVGYFILLLPPKDE